MLFGLRQNSDMDLPDRAACLVRAPFLMFLATSWRGLSLAIVITFAKSSLLSRHPGMFTFSPMGFIFVIFYILWCLFCSDDDRQR